MANDNKTKDDDKVETFTRDQVQQMIADETGGLKSKIDELLTEAKEAKAKAREESARAAKEAEEKAKASGDVEALEKSWSEKYSSREAELTSAMTEKDKIIARLTAGNEAKTLASELALKGSERVLERIISDRLGVEIVEGQPKVIVKDAAGQRSAQTLDDLRKELQSDTSLKPILQGSKGTGAGGVGSGTGAGGASANGNLGGTKQERVAAIRARFPELNS